MDHHRYIPDISGLHGDCQCAEAMVYGIWESGHESGGLQSVYQAVQCPEYMECVWQNESETAFVDEFPGRHQSVVHDLGLSLCFRSISFDVYVFSEGLFLTKVVETWICRNSVSKLVY